MTIEQLHGKLISKEIKVEELVHQYYEKIEAKDKDISAYISLCKDNAMKNAVLIQERINQNKDITPLTGIPMAIKDNMCTKDSKTTCGSKMLENFEPPYNATVVEKLESSGSILLGKLNMDEFAMGGSTENSAFKKTKNPYDLSRVPGGSSGGSAACVAADMAVFTLGSDTGGSIRQPASFCGVVGLKPTYGTISRYGLVAFASSLDQIGPITKTVTDAGLVLNATAGKDKYDSTSSERNIADYNEYLKKDIKNIKLAVPRQYLASGISAEVKDSILNAINEYEKMGIVCEYVDLKLADYAIAAYYIISSAEASSNLARYDGIKYGYHSENYTNLIELYKNSRSEGFGAEVKRRIMLGTYALSSGYYDAYYKKALQVRTLIKNEFDKIFETYDGIIGPTAPTTAYKIGEKSEDPLEMYLGDVYTVSVNIAGLPAISIPCGFDSHHLPVGLQIIGKAFDERKILQIAYAYEQQSSFQGLIKEAK
ncbi:MAG: Asp-tRNA(Asn)/Glu-tRNA(Gln) amidotransferase subunit GatA [Clostridia bacterium]|nr:Asp-tRNA(Asn)/Glu-tRNA(Gln) amidotransferase subunit GatA [Clostridia bacterium]